MRTRTKATVVAVAVLGGLLVSAAPAAATYTSPTYMVGTVADGIVRTSYFECKTLNPRFESYRLTVPAPSEVTELSVSTLPDGRDRIKLSRVTPPGGPNPASILFGYTCQPR